MAQLNRIVFFVLLSSFFVFAQPLVKRTYHPFTGTLVFSVEGGPTYSQTDYNAPAQDYSGRGSLEYYFPIYSKSAFGIKATGGFGFLTTKDNSRTPAEIRTGITFAGGGVVYLVSIGEAVFPYLFAGATYLWFDPKGSDGELLPNNKLNVYRTNELNYNAEIGLRIGLTSNLTLNFGAMVHISPNDNIDDIKVGTNNDMFFTGVAGLSFSFFSNSDDDNDGVEDSRDMCPNTPDGIKVNQDGCPIDSDSDGVPDYLDDCNDTPAMVKVSKNGCPVDTDKDGIPDYIDICANTPAGALVDEFGCPKDSDDDGIPDYLDDCPATPKNAPIDKNGCPLDTDKDGVADYIDKCPNTPAGVQVDASGCPLEKEQIIKEVPVIKEVQIPVEKEIVLSAGASFQVGKATLLPAAYPELDKIVKVMKDYPASNWIIEGHTDNTGTYEINKKLSTKRAEAVLNYFVSKGIKKERFTVRGLGPDFPIADNATEEGRQKNRRVVIIRVD